MTSRLVAIEKRHMWKSSFKRDEAAADSQSQGFGRPLLEEIEFRGSGWCRRLFLILRRF
jgi:hypothetical protein